MRNLPDPAHFIDISIPVSFHAEGPLCYWAEPASAETVEMGGFVGSVTRGGPVNHAVLCLTPHANGTHTECYGHISADPEATLRNCIDGFFYKAQIVSVHPEKIGEDMAVKAAGIIDALLPGIEALIVRTLPNDEAKRTRNHSGTNPPYFEAALAEELARRGVRHFITDLPSVDKEVDGGALAFHKAFFQIDNPRRNATITELAFVPDRVTDGPCELLMMVPLWDTDAAPSRLLVRPTRQGN